MSLQFENGKPGIYNVELDVVVITGMNVNVIVE